MAATKALSDKDMGGRKVINNGAPTAAGDAATKQYVDDASTADRSRANHTGTQTASTISDFDTQVRTSRLDQMAAPTGPVALGSQRITGLADPTSAQDAATRAYVDAQLSGVTSGQVLKGTVRAAVATNVNIASPGATLDGLTASAGDVFLLTGQSTGTENGPYVWNGAASAMTRASNWDTTAEAVRGSYWVVREGTQADRFALLTNDTDITIGTTVPTFTFIGATAGGSSNGYSATSPAVTAGNSWTVTHNLASRLVIVQVFRSASPYDEVDVYVARTTANTVDITPDVAMAAGEYTALVWKVA
ncbi:hypothetical protein ACFXGA_06055 [Actinosynnema sp. NPDC059335]|uniref:hypothetical protein n=1 Tax=Actinosynnema sp. NPDC059335 TaxID=3346804 RepID=UPI00366A9103